MRSKMSACCFLVLVLTAVSFAQDDKSKSHPDFGGSWVLDAAKSQSVTGGNFGSSDTERLTVTMKDVEFRLHRKTMMSGKASEGDRLYCPKRASTKLCTFGVRL